MPDPHSSLEFQSKPTDKITEVKSMLEEFRKCPFISS